MHVPPVLHPAYSEPTSKPNEEERQIEWSGKRMPSFGRNFFDIVAAFTIAMLGRVLQSRQALGTSLAE